MMYLKSRTWRLGRVARRLEFAPKPSTKLDVAVHNELSLPGPVRTWTSLPEAAMRLAHSKLRGWDFNVSRDHRGKWIVRCRPPSFIDQYGGYGESRFRAIAIMSCLLGTLAHAEKVFHRPVHIPDRH